MGETKRTSLTLEFGFRTVTRNVHRIEIVRNLVSTMSPKRWQKAEELRALQQKEERTVTVTG
jgi:hypothetical protein